MARLSVADALDPGQVDGLLLAYIRGLTAQLAAPTPRTQAQQKQQERGKDAMHYTVVQRSGQTYLKYEAPQARPQTIDATQFVADCMEHRANLVMLESGALPEAFFRLATGVAGEVMQKLAQYHVKAALVLQEAPIRGKFGDMLVESNRGQTFRFFSDAVQAERWLTQG